MSRTLGAPVRPRYRDADHERLGTMLDDARRRKKELQAQGFSTKGVDEEIQSLRFQLREGGQLGAGDWLLERYQLIERVGKGGFASVWKAYDDTERRAVAVKVLHPDIAEDPVKRDRFFRGALTMMELGHEAIVRVREPHGEDGKFYFFVMEFIDGHDLREMVKRRRLVGYAAIPVVLQVGEALAVAHARGLTHRDVKPSNILIGQDGSPHLTDFDLVHDPDSTLITRTAPMGTYVYAAPEVLDRPQDATPAADVYSLGKTLVFCLRGYDLPVAETPPEQLIAELDASAAVKAVLRKALQGNPSDRFTNAEEFCEAVRAALVAPDEPAPEPQRRRRAVPLLFAASLVAAVSAGLVAARSSAAVGYLRDLFGVDRRIKIRPDTLTIASAVPVVPVSSTPSSIAPIAPSAPDVRATSIAPTPSCPEGMALIPPGRFMMGTQAGGGGVRERLVSIADALCMDRTEVTVSAYRACVDANGCAPPQEGAVMFCSSARKNKIPSGEPQGEHPVTCVSWDQADSYCKWQNKRLPREAEWEYAARGPESRLYPWGPQYPSPQRLNVCDQRCTNYYAAIDEKELAQKRLFMADDGYPMTSRVGAYPDGESPFGLMDMAGNVAEWVGDKYCDYTEDSCSPGDSRRVARGGSWRTTDAVFVRPSHREALIDKAYNYVGFRCAKSIR